MIWRSCPGYPEYEISDHGDIKRVSPNASGQSHNCGKNLRSRVSNSGYLEIYLGPKRKRKQHFIHRLVLRAFVGEPPSDKHWVAHNDGRRLNNALTNLRWALPSDNQADKRIHGTHMEGTAVPTSKLSAEKVIQIRARWESARKDQDGIAKEFGISQAAVSRVVMRRTWKHVS